MSKALQAPRRLHVGLVAISLLAALSIMAVFLFYYVRASETIRAEVVRSGQVAADRWLSGLGGAGDEIARTVLRQGPTVGGYEYFAQVMSGTDIAALRLTRPGEAQGVMFTRDMWSACQPDVRAALSAAVPRGSDGARLMTPLDRTSGCTNLFVAVTMNDTNFGGIGTETQVIVDRTETYEIARAAMARALELSAILAALGLVGTIITAVLTHLVSQRDRRMRHMADHDALTGLPNRFRYNRVLEQWTAGRTAPKPVTLLLIDLDGFKAVNDSLGHDYGDILLKRIAERLVFVGGDDAMVARLGGDEFAMVIRDRISEDQSLALGERIIETVSQIDRINGVPVVIGASVGIAAIPDEADDVEMLQQRADVALYRVKETGKGAALRFTEIMNNEYQRRYVVRQRLRDAIEDDGLLFVFHPIHRASDGDLMGFEALARLPDGAGGHFVPSDFIPVAEEVGQIGELGERTLKAACQAIAAFPERVRVAVNVSPRQITPDLPHRLHRILGHTRLDPNRLQLELTESPNFAVTPQVVATLRECRSMGVSLALDNFGSSSSTLAFLWKLPFDRIKVDPSVFRAAIERSDGLELLRGLISLPLALSVSPTVAGVETEEQHEIAVAAGFEHLQGFLFSEPIRADELVAYSSRMARQSIPGGPGPVRLPAPFPGGDETERASSLSRPVLSRLASLAPSSATTR